MHDAQSTSEAVEDTIGDADAKVVKSLTDLECIELGMRAPLRLKAQNTLLKQRRLLQ